MNRTFVDTFYDLALLNPRDESHEAAVAVGPTLTGGLVTTHFVLAEVADALASTRERPKFLALMRLLESEADVEIVPGGDALFRRGVAPYRSRPDKDWSLTDCTSFVVMGDRGITDALTADHHFRQAGFRTLLGGP